MNILFDQGTPVPLRRSLPPHSVDTAAEQGWSQLDNGDLIHKAEESGYDAMITTDQNIKYQQNLADRKIRLLVLKTTSWPKIQHKTHEIKTTLEEMCEGAYVELGC
jgi:predicted nuclease of predicted toxin-antitoxin system